VYESKQSVRRFLIYLFPQTGVRDGINKATKREKQQNPRTPTPILTKSHSWVCSHVAVAEKNRIL
jgi:hypothetical protein